MKYRCRTGFHSRNFWHTSLAEKHAIDGVIFGWGLDERDVKAVYDVLEHGASVNELLREFADRKSYYLLLQELITLAHLDGSYGKEEQAAVHEVAGLCGVSASRVADLEAWVEEGIAWRARGATLIRREEV
jgi:hypothetical protein